MKIDNIQDFITKLKEIVGLTKEPEEIANNIEAMDFSLVLSADDAGELHYNYTALFDYVSEFAFDWREEAYDSEDSFLEDGIADIKQMLMDIDEHNLYKPVFRVKSVYTNKEWDGKDQWQDIEAKTIEKVKQLTDDIRANSPKALPDKPDMTLLDVILSMEILNNKGNFRYKRNIEPEHGAYFNPR